MSCGPKTGGRPAEGQIDLWHANLRHSDWKNLEHLLSVDERRRAAAFAFPRDARRFVVARAVLRVVLGEATGLAPDKLAFRTGLGRKPTLDHSLGQSVHFSLSRSAELVLIGLASRPLGVDVEWLAQDPDIEALADAVLSSREQELLRRLDPAHRREAFLQCWVQKEAYLKAIGRGLQVCPATVEVRLGPNTLAGIEYLAGDLHAASGWFVDLVTPQEGYIGAVAMRGRPPDVRATAFDSTTLLERTRS